MLIAIPLIIILGGLLVFGSLGVFLEVIPPPRAMTLVWFRAGSLKVQRGRVQAQAREHIAGLLREAGVSKGFIAITADRRVEFSRHIPRELRQRLRNVILNQ